MFNKVRTQTFLCAISSVLIVLFVFLGCGRVFTDADDLSEGLEIPATPETSASNLQNVVPEYSEVQMVFSVSDLIVGNNRIAFGLIDKELGPVIDSQVQISTFFLTEQTQEGPLQIVSATYRAWPMGSGGVYTAQIKFDRAGTWGLAATVEDGNGSVSESSARVEVKNKSLVPMVGSLAPRSVTKTIQEGREIREITTDPSPDRELYKVSLVDALNTGMPLVVSFSTPGYCATTTCGPQLDVIKQLKNQYNKRIQFIHVEIYDNPQEIEGDLRRGRLSEVIKEWGLPSEPWTFVIDRKGIVSARFEGFTTYDELIESLEITLD